MDPIDVSRTFDSYYFAHGCGRPYQRDELWLNMFNGIAEHIVNKIAPSSVLDAGCAMGFLVEALHKHDVEAHGIDISAYAIQNVQQEIRPYCRVASVADPLPQTYDLIVCIEVLEHVPSAEAEQAVANFCRNTGDILFSSTPHDYKEVTHENVRPPEYWAELFAQHEFYRDVDFDASFITPWAVRFRRGRDSSARVIAGYERRYWQLLQENQARRQLNLEQRNELAVAVRRLENLEEQAEHHAQIVHVLNNKNRELETRQALLEASLGGRLLKQMQFLRAWIAPPLSIRDQVLDNFLQRVVLGNRNRQKTGKSALNTEPITNRAPVRPHEASVDIIVCVHNALADVQRCFESIVHHTSQPYALILVDDGSDAPTEDFLRDFATQHGAVLIHNEKPMGYGRAANQGLHQSSAEYALLLNSDTIVTHGWLDKLVCCAESNPRHGLIGPLSNTASWQSIPEVVENDDWASNQLPGGVDIDEMARRLEHYSARLYPTVPFLNGFCYLIRRSVIEQIGYFDEEHFGDGYGEENDYTLRARQAGWLAAVADDTYIYHVQSSSYSHERRRQLAERAGKSLAQKHGQQVIDEGSQFWLHNKVPEGIRACSRIMQDREDCLEEGRRLFAGRSVLFLLPVSGPTGGANVVIDEAAAMRSMGVNVALFNSADHRMGFEKYYSHLDMPVIYDDWASLGDIAEEFDAIVATWHRSVEWLSQIRTQNAYPALGYYAQDFEPYMYEQGTPEYDRALRSYSLVPTMVRFTKTEWTRQEVLAQAHLDCEVVGVSINTDLFRPRPLSSPAFPNRPIRVAAMVRTISPYRAPQMTMKVLRDTAKHFGQQVEVVIFGTAKEDPSLLALPHDFPHTSVGILNQKQVARLLNEIDIFVDYSYYQAMGLTALEAMACGAAVIVPEQGGAVSFASHGENSLIVDTRDTEACRLALWRLVQDHELRQRLQKHALTDVQQFHVERPAFNILRTLFGSDPP